MWDHVCYAFNQSAPAEWPHRDSDSLRRKFLGLKNKSKPSGDPHCPPDVNRAKRVYEEIKSHTTLLIVNSSQCQDVDDEVSSEVSDSNISDPPQAIQIQPRATPRLGLTPEALVSLKPERGTPVMSMAAQRRSSLDAVIGKLIAQPTTPANDSFLALMMKMDEREQQWRMEQSELRRQERQEREQRDRQDKLEREERKRESRKREEKHDLLMMALMSKLIGKDDHDK
ncbi:hypothetical protein AeMF1_015116 [Aphanomyces euteiches]|nr:hypothetical protein AeMF1_015116 [Aphanomyces euteiches]